jgi:hypothetical protein
MTRNSAQRQRIGDQILADLKWLQSKPTPPGGWTNHEWRYLLADATWDCFHILTPKHLHTVRDRVMDDLAAKDAALIRYYLPRSQR